MSPKFFLLQWCRSLKKVENHCPKPQGISYLERETEEQAGRWVGGPQKDRLKVMLQTERYRGETERQIKGYVTDREI